LDRGRGFACAGNGQKRKVLLPKGRGIILGFVGRVKAQ